MITATLERRSDDDGRDSRYVIKSQAAELSKFENGERTAFVHAAKSFFLCTASENLAVLSGPGSENRIDIARRYSQTQKTFEADIS